MSGWELHWRGNGWDSSLGRIDASGWELDRWQSLDKSTISQRAIGTDPRQGSIGDWFEISATKTEQITMVGDFQQVDCLASTMSQATLNVQGIVGDYFAIGLNGGNASSFQARDFAAAGMRRGTLTISGSVGDNLAMPLPGERRGLRGGVIHIGGNCGDRAGDRMRRGLIVIEGDAGSHCGARMIAGTICVAGNVGNEAGIRMRRGSLILRKTPEEIVPTFTREQDLELGYLTLLLRWIGSLPRLNKEQKGWELSGWPDKRPVHQTVRRWIGDRSCQGLGEIIVL